MLSHNGNQALKNKCYMIQWNMKHFCGASVNKEVNNCFAIGYSQPFKNDVYKTFAS